METKKVVLITGGAKGIGRATTEIFAKNGYKTYFVQRSESEGKELEQSLNNQGFDTKFIRCDVSKEAEVKNVIDTIVAECGKIDVLVNNAGRVLVKPFVNIEWDEFQTIMNTNLGGTFLFNKYVLRVMKEQKYGAIVNMASVSGHVGQTEHVMYGATKGGIIAMTRALAWEFAKYNIRINSVSPGSVDTEMLRSDIANEAKEFGREYADVKKEREAEQAFNRWADPSEIASAIYFLASDGASFITGTDLLVDCGWVAK